MRKSIRTTGRVTVRPLFLAVLLFCSPTLRGADAPPTWIVVTAPAFRQAIEPLVQHRAAEGFHTTVITTTDVLTPQEIRHGEADKLRDRLAALCRESPGKPCILLIGVAYADSDQNALATVVPALSGKVGRMKNQPSDNGFGCLGEDLLPTVAVGRFPARSADEARDMAGKTIAFERDGRQAPWRRGITLLVGNPGGDSAAERALGNWYVGSACQATTEKINPAWSVRSIYHIPGSPWYVPDASLHEQAVQSLQAGQAFTCYLGHSDDSGFWSGGARFLDRTDWSTLKLQHGAGVFVTCGCFACQLDRAGREEHEGYGLAAIRNPAGPVAVAGASGESYAAAGQLAFNGLLGDMAGPSLPQRLGDAWLDLKAGIAKGPMDFLTFTLFDHADGSHGTVPLAVQRKEHLEMWTLLGDPALHLPVIAPEIQLTVPKSAAAGAAVTIHGSLPAQPGDARVRVIVERPAGGRPLDLIPVPAGPADVRDRAILANYAKANDPVLLVVEGVARNGQFDVTLPLPKDLPWPHVVIRAASEGKDQDAVGAMALEIEEPEK